MSKGSGVFKFNSPVILIFTLMCFAAFGLNIATGGTANALAFSVYRGSFTDPLFYVRLVGHVLGHASWEHLSGNLMYILLLGPLLEEKYGSKNMAFIFVITAVTTGLVNVLLFENVVLLGASGIVFALIILSSITGAKDGKIPVTFVIVVIIYLGGQIFDGILVKDNISNLTHIVGGIVGAICGCKIKKK